MKRTIISRLSYIFSKHPRSIGESYFEHLTFAFCSGLKMTFGGLACIIHSIFPFIFIDTASHTVKTLTQDFEKRRNK